MNGRGKIAVIALVCLVIFLLSSVVSEAEKRRASDRKRDAAIATLADSYDKVADKVADYLIKIDAAAEAAQKAGEEVVTTREQFIESLKNTLPQEVLDKAVEIANQKAKAGPPGPAGPAGKTGATGPAGKTAESPSSTTSSTTTTTTTSPAPTTTTTTRRSTTTTTKPCTVKVLGIGVLCG